MLFTKDEKDREKELRGQKKLIETIGKDFVRKYQDKSIWAVRVINMEESEYFHEPEGVYCFLGISLKPEDPVPTLSGSLDD